MKTHEKTAELSMQLEAESGYEATAHYRISPAQWGDVLRVCEGDLSFDTLRERDLLRAALVKLVGAETREEIEGMWQVITKMGDCDPDGGQAIRGALDALLKTMPEGA